MRIASRILALAAAALALSAGAPAQAQQPIRIGVLLPLTGPFAKNGIENWEAMQIARDMINERGGVNGRKIEFVHGDATEPDRGDQRDRAPHHQGWHQDHHRLVRLAAGDRGQPGGRAARRVPLGDHGRRRNHHPARLQAHLPGRRRRPIATARRRSISPSTSSPKQARQAGRPTCASRCCGRTAPSASRSATASAPTRRRRASS